MDLTVICIVSVVVLLGIAAAHDIARRHVAGLKEAEFRRLETVVEAESRRLTTLIDAETGARNDDFTLLFERAQRLEQRLGELGRDLVQHEDLVKLQVKCSDLQDRLSVVEDRPQSASQALIERVEMHEQALKNALKQIREQFSELDQRWAELERKLKTDVSGTIAAATDGMGGTNWRQV